MFLQGKHDERLNGHGSETSYDEAGFFGETGSRNTVVFAPQLRALGEKAWEITPEAFR